MFARNHGSVTDEIRVSWIMLRDQGRGKLRSASFINLQSPLHISFDELYESSPPQGDITKQ